MLITELDTFVRKFHQLWKDGFTAHLDLDTQAGNAWVGLRLNLGQVPGPVHGHAPPFPHPCKHVSPSKQRRRARREAARTTRAEEAETEKVIEENSEVDTEQVSAVITIFERKRMTPLQMKLKKLLILIKLKVLLMKFVQIMNILLLKLIVMPVMKILKCNLSAIMPRRI